MADIHDPLSTYAAPRTADGMTCSVCGRPGRCRSVTECLHALAEHHFDWRVACALVKRDVSWLDPGRVTTAAELEQMAFAIGGQLEEAQRSLKAAQAREKALSAVYVDLMKETRNG